jgi:hypothetical protein
LPLHFISRFLLLPDIPLAFTPSSPTLLPFLILPHFYIYFSYPVLLPFPSTPFSLSFISSPSSLSSSLLFIQVA